MIDAPQLALLQPHALIVNCARGGVIEETALLAALDANALAGAAIDVVAVEPPPPGGTGARLHLHPKVVATPHLGGSTFEALERIATELAHDVASVLLGGPAAAAVNAPIASGPDAEMVRPFVDLAYRLGKLYPQLAQDASLPRFTLVREGRLADVEPDALVTAFLSGLLQTTTDRRVTIVNARSIAVELGVIVDEHGGPGRGAFASSLRVTGGRTSLAGTVAPGGPRVVEIDGFEVDANPRGSLLITRHDDVPGMIGKLGTVLGEAQVNISTMQVSRLDAGGDAMMILAVDRPAEPATLDALRAVPGIRSVRALDL
jgi:D-3-phosphoglycerate dehydrogenase